MQRGDRLHISTYLSGLETGNLATRSPHDQEELEQRADARGNADAFSIAAVRLGVSEDALYAAFDAIPPDILHWLRSDAECYRLVRALISPTMSTPEIIE